MTEELGKMRSPVDAREAMEAERMELCRYVRQLLTKIRELGVGGGPLRDRVLELESEAEWLKEKLLVFEHIPKIRRNPPGSRTDLTLTCECFFCETSPAAQHQKDCEVFHGVGKVRSKFL